MKEILNYVQSSPDRRIKISYFPVLYLTYLLKLLTQYIYQSKPLLQLIFLVHLVLS
jgi:hypothetical protein